MTRKSAGITYFTVLGIVILTTCLALLDGGYHIAGAVIAGIAFASVVSSLIPYFISMFLLRKYEENPSEKKHLKVWGWIFYSFCFPVKLWITLSNIDLLIHGGGRWAFG